MRRHAALVMVVLLLGLAGCKRHRAGSVVGTWAADSDGAHLVMTLDDEGQWDMTGTGPALAGATVSVAGTYTLKGTTLSFTPLTSDVTGPVAPEQRAQMKQQLLTPEPNNTVDFASPDEFVETAPDGREMTFKRVAQRSVP